MEKTFYIVNAFRFVAEVMTMIIFIVYGLKFTFPYQLVLGILLPIVILIIWGLFVAPKSPHRLSLLPKFIVESLIFTSAYLIYHHFSDTSLPTLFFIYAITTSICSKINDKILGIC